MLSTATLFDWQRHVTEHRKLRNLSAAQAEILIHLARLIEADDCEPTDARLAAETGYGISTAQEARRRAKALGLLGWAHQWHQTAQGRRQRANRYWLRTPAGDAEARPDLRRHRAPVGVLRPRQVAIEEKREWLPPVPQTTSEQRIMAAWEARRSGRAPLVR